MISQGKRLEFELGLGFSSHLQQIENSDFTLFKIVIVSLSRLAILHCCKMLLMIPQGGSQHDTDLDHTIVKCPVLKPPDGAISLRKLDE